MQAPSCTFTLLPILIKLTSPRTTVLNQKLQSSPAITSPTIVALGAIKQLLPNCGCLSSTGSITGMYYFFVTSFSFSWHRSLRRTLHRPVRCSALGKWDADDADAADLNG